MKNKGITLIALVITIVILLILAGISIALILGENGMLTKSAQAKEAHQIAYAKEKLELAVAEYEATLRTETLYNILNKVEGLTRIEPDNELDGPPYLVEVDGYEFLIKEDLSIVYQGKVTGIIPEITKFEKKIESDTKASLIVEARTEDSMGIQSIILIQNGIEIQKIMLSGLQISQEIEINGNGTYQIKVIGVNKRQAVSREIKVDEMSIGVVNITAGTVLEGKTVLTITGELEQKNVKKLELYRNNHKIKEISYENEKVTVEEEIETDYMIFFEENSYVAKLIGENNEIGISNTVIIKNTDRIQTEQGLKNLATQVNSGNNFSGKTIKQIANITLASTHIAIGNEQHPFCGTYDGNNKQINNIQINIAGKYQGLFGYIDNSIIKNVILGNGSIIAENQVGGIVGKNRLSTIANCKNNGTTVMATGYYELSLDSSINKIAAVGGIVGYNLMGDILSCTNMATITGSYELIGGIVGYVEGSTNKRIENCTNSGKIQAMREEAWYTGGIVGGIYLDMKVANCTNHGIVQSSARGVGGIVGSLGNASTQVNVVNCINTTSVTGIYEVGGIVGAVGNSDNNNSGTISSCQNKGTITSSKSTVTSWEQEGVSGTTAQVGRTGGIAGVAYSIKFLDCYNRGSIIAKESAAGGIVGEARAVTIEQCGNYDSVTISGANTSMAAGGIAGFIHYNSSITKCSNSGNIKAITNQVGGICGSAIYTNLTNCYNIGTITGGDIVGGVVGNITGRTIKIGNTSIKTSWRACYNAGNISGGSHIGSLLGECRNMDVNYLYGKQLTGIPIGGYYDSDNITGSSVEELNSTNMTSYLLDKLKMYDSTAWKIESGNNNLQPILDWE